MAPGLYFSFQDRAAEAAADLFLRGHVPASLLRQQQHQPLGTVFLLYGEQVSVKAGGLGARGRNTFKSLPWSVLVMGNHRTCYLQGAALLLCPSLMYTPLVFLPSEKCCSAAKGEFEHSAHWTLLQD